MFSSLSMLISFLFLLIVWYGLWKDFWSCCRYSFLLVLFILLLHLHWFVNDIYLKWIRTPIAFVSVIYCICCVSHYLQHNTLSLPCVSSSLKIVDLFTHQVTLAFAFSFSGWQTLDAFCTCIMNLWVDVRVIYIFYFIVINDSTLIFLFFSL